MAMTKGFLIRLRQHVRSLYQEQRLTRTVIAARLGVSLPFVRKWIQEAAVTHDRRGWPRGRLRRRTPQEVSRILALRQWLVQAGAFFWGPDAIAQAYAAHHRGAPIPPRRFIARTLRQHGMATRHRRLRHRGGARRRHYPARALARLGQVREQLDLIGPRFLTGSARPIYLLSGVYVQPARLAVIRRLAVPTTGAILGTLLTQWQQDPWPDVVSPDNDVPFIAAGGDPQARLGPFAIALLNVDVQVVFLPYRQPWAHGHVEAHNGVFARKLWRVRHFDTLAGIDAGLTAFNTAYAAYHRAHWPAARRLPSGFQPPPDWCWRLSQSHPRPIHFIRLVEAVPEDRASIEVLRTRIPVAPAYLHQFVLATLDLERHQLTVAYEQDDGTLAPLGEHPFSVRWPTRPSRVWQ